MISAQARPLQRTYRVFVVLLVRLGLYGVQVGRAADVFRAISQLNIVVELVLHHVVEDHVFVYLEIHVGPLPLVNHESFVVPVVPHLLFIDSPLFVHLLLVVLLSHLRKVLVGEHGVSLFESVEVVLPLALILVDLVQYLASLQVGLHFLKVSVLLVQLHLALVLHLNVPFQLHLFHL